MSQGVLSNAQFRGTAVQHARAALDSARQYREQGQMWNGGAALEDLEYRGPSNTAHSMLNTAASSRRAAQYAGPSG